MEFDWEQDIWISLSQSHCLLIRFLRGHHTKNNASSKEGAILLLGGPVAPNGHISMEGSQEELRT